MDKLSSLSIFFPAFNEEDNIKIALNKALKIAPTLSNKYEVIVIDDGSKDKTVEVVEEFIKKNKNVKLVKHKTNQGYGGALKTGFSNSKNDYITYMDADNQFDFYDLKKLVDQIANNDVVVGFRIKRADSFVRVMNGRLWNLLCSILLRLPIKDIDCGFKLVRKKVIDTIPPLESNGATISAELLVKAGNRGFKIAQVGLNHKPRTLGAATGGNPLHIFRAFNDLVQLIHKI